MGIETPDHYEKKEDSPDKKDGPDRGVLVFSHNSKSDTNSGGEGIELFPTPRGADPKQEAQERKDNLEELDQKLQIETLRGFVKQTEGGTYQVTTDISGEKYTFTLQNFHKGKESIRDNAKMMEDLDKKKTNINELTAGFTCVAIEGRPELLNLDYKVNVTDLISGSTNLAEQVRQTFAGTDDHYKKIYQNQEKVEVTEQQKEQRSTTIEAVSKSLKEQNYTVSEITYEDGPTILHAFMPGQERQITVSSLDGAVWSLTAKSTKGERERSLVSPNELINTLNSEEIW